MGFKGAIGIFLLRHFFLALCWVVPAAIYCEDFSVLRQELQQKTSTTSKEPFIEILNVSYDPTREFYTEYNHLFTEWWKKQTNQSVSIVQSHGGSGKQARSIISGLKADVVSLALAFDIDSIQKATAVVGEHWQDRLPNKSTPYFSTIVFIVRKGNPKNIKDWNDLIQQGISLIISNPKTSGGAKWTYLAAYGWFLDQSQNDLDKTYQQMIKLYANTPILDTGARGSTTTFIQRKMGDVLITWENEAFLVQEKTENSYQIIYPSMSIRTEPPVAWLENILEKNGTQDVAHFYLKYLYSSTAQDLIAKHHFRPSDSAIREKYKKKFPEIKMFSIDRFGGWEKAYEIHLRDEGLFDNIYKASRKN